MEYTGCPILLLVSETAGFRGNPSSTDNWPIFFTRNRLEMVEFISQQLAFRFSLTWNVIWPTKNNFLRSHSITSI